MGFIFSYVRYRHPRRVAHRVAPLVYATRPRRSRGVQSLGTCTATPPLTRKHSHPLIPVEHFELARAAYGQVQTASGDGDGAAGRSARRNGRGRRRRRRRRRRRSDRRRRRRAENSAGGDLDGAAEELREVARGGRSRVEVEALPRARLPGDDLDGARDDGAPRHGARAPRHLERAVERGGVDGRARTRARRRALGRARRRAGRMGDGSRGPPARVRGS